MPSSQFNVDGRGCQFDLRTQIIIRVGRARAIRRHQDGEVNRHQTDPQVMRYVWSKVRVRAENGC